MTACIYYETVPQPRSPETAAQDIVRVMQKYASHPAHLKIDGKPVVFVYGRAMGELGLTGWMKAIDWMDVLSWEQVADGMLTTGQYDIALYCGGETYRRSVHKAGDVDDALAAYLENGGTLVAAPAMPWPFYYDQDGHPVQKGRLFGLTIRMGWENPPAGTQLEFIRLAPSMKHTPDRFDFPTSGDLRWRAFVNEGHKAYTPLLQLRNSKGESLGDGAAYAELQGGGRVVSIWFTLLNGPYAEPILYDVFDFLAGRLTAPRSQSSWPAARTRASHRTASRRFLVASPQFSQDGH